MIQGLCLSCTKHTQRECTADHQQQSNPAIVLQARVHEGCIVEVVAQRNQVHYLVTNPPMNECSALTRDVQAQTYAVDPQKSGDQQQSRR